MGIGGIARLAGGIGARTGLLGALLRLGNSWTLGSGEDGGARGHRARRRTSTPFQVLLFHRVTDIEEPFFDTVPVRVFDGQMALLRRHFNVLPLDELVERSGRNDVPSSAVAITFDDGYRDNYENAFPILRRHGLPATVFLTTAAVGTREVLWHDRILDAFRQTEATSLEVDGTSLPMRTPLQKRTTAASCLRRVRSLDPRGRDREIARVMSALGVAATPEARWRKLSWDEIREMANGGISFGAHTVTHPILTRMPIDEAGREILESRDAIERALGKKVTLFAYPNGGPTDFNDDVKRVVRDAGFRCAVTTIPGTNDAATDLFELKRVALWDPAPHQALMRLAWSKLTS